MVPITTEFEVRKRFYAGESGSIYLGTGMHPIFLIAFCTVQLPHTGSCTSGLGLG